MEQSISESRLQSPANRRGTAILLLVTLLMAVLWLYVLPKIGKNPEFQRHIRLREEQGIESAAMFYSDLPAAKTATEHLDQLERDNPHLFWLP